MTSVAATIIVWILIFILPFLIFPIGISQFEAPKVYAAELGIIILSLLGIFANYKHLIKVKVPLILFSLLFFLTLYHLLFRMTPAAFLGNIFRQQGIFLLWLLMLFSFFKFTKLGILKTTSIGILFLISSFLLPFALAKDVVYENRAEIWQTSIISGYQHPFLGWGFGNTEVALKQYNKKLYNNLQGYYVDSAHNIFIDYWIQGGFLGLSILLLLIYISIKNFIIKKSVMNITLLLGLMITLSFNPSSIVGLIGFWYILGQGLFGQVD